MTHNGGRQAPLQKERRYLKRGVASQSEMKYFVIFTELASEKQPSTTILPRCEGFVGENRRLKGPRGSSRHDPARPRGLPDDHKFFNVHLLKPHPGDLVQRTASGGIQRVVDIRLVRAGDIEGAFHEHISVVYEGPEEAERLHAEARHQPGRDATERIRSWGTSSSRR